MSEQLDQAGVSWYTYGEIPSMDKATPSLPDPRRGVPSASEMERLVSCPGSWWASRGMPDEESEDAASGTRIHAALETGDYSQLSPSEEETAMMCQTQLESVLESWGNNTPQPTRSRELRLGLTSIGGVLPVTPESTADFVFTGQSDVIVIDGERGFIADFKTGRGDVENATGNLQLRALAVLVSKAYRLRSVRVAIIQPWAGKPTLADYDADALTVSWAWLDNALEAVANAEPDSLRAGDWCHYCKAKANCPALRSEALAPIETLAVSTYSMDAKTQRAALFARAMELPADVLAGLVKGLRVVGYYTDAITGAAKKRAADDAEFQRWYQLKPGATREKIVDVGLVYQRISEMAVSGEDFAKACSLTKTDLEALLRKATGFKGKALKEALSQATEGATESKETSYQLDEADQS